MSHEENETKDQIFSKPWKGSDVVMVIKTKTNSFTETEETVEEEKRIHVHSNLISFFSPVFEELLNGVTGEPKEIELVDKNYDDIVLLVKNLYPQYESKLGKRKELLF